MSWGVAPCWYEAGPLALAEMEFMKAQPLKLLILGAHPDDAEFRAGGLAAIYRSLGHTVKMVSVTDGGSGHHAMKRPELIARRHKEAAAAAAAPRRAAPSRP